VTRLNKTGLFSFILAALLLGGCGGEVVDSSAPEKGPDELSNVMFGTPALGSGGGAGGSSIMGLNAPNGAKGGKALPADFPQLKDTGGMGEGEVMAAWGGDPGKDRKANRAALKHTPVILIHGNGASAYGNPIWGFMWDLKWDDTVKFLRSKGYNTSEIWAVSYLGQAPIMAQLSKPYTSNIDDVRSFIDAVRVYLGVQKVDLVAHSLGAVLARGYIAGLQRTGKWDDTKHRLDAVGAVVTLSGANYGFGHDLDMYAAIVGEMLTGFPLEKNSHLFKGIKDDTPGGQATTKQKLTTPAIKGLTDGDFRGKTSLDNGSINWVALWHKEDQVDKYYPGTGRLWGANLNQQVESGLKDALKRHISLMHRTSFMALYYPYLNKVGVVPGKNLPSTPTPGSSGSFTCKTVTSSTYGHVAIGRARMCGFFHACAKGSNQDLGTISMLTKVQLAQTKSGYYTKGACP
jgi:hypothetical protein